MGRLTNDMRRLAGAIQMGRQERAQATAHRKRAVAELRGSFAADLAGARTAWLGAMARFPAQIRAPKAGAPSGWGGLAIPEPLRRGASEPKPAVPVAEPEGQHKKGGVLHKLAQKLRPVKAKRPAREGSRRK